MKKRIISIFLAIITLVSCMTFAVQADAWDVKTDFFDSDALISRGMVTAILADIYDYDYGDKTRVDTATQFSDVSTDAYYYEAANWACSLGLIDGLGNGEIGLDMSITRAQLWRILFETANYFDCDISDERVNLEFADVSPGNWYEEYVYFAYGNGLVQTDETEGIVFAEPNMKAKLSDFANIFSVFPSENFDMDVEGDYGNISFSYSGTTGELVVSGSGAIDKTPWHEFSQSVRTVKIEEGITSIADDTFNLCEDLVSVFVPESLKSIGKNAFDNCLFITDVYYAGAEWRWDTVDIKDGNDYFKNATIHFAKEETHTCSFTNYVYNNDATVDADGTETATCDCGKTDTRIKVGSKLQRPLVTIKDTSKIFTDIISSKWYKQYVDYAYSYGFFKGMTDTTFEPNTSLTRGMFVTVLSRISGAKINNDVTTKFKDVAKGKWYTGAVKWANDNGIVNGLTETQFGTNENITREQMCTMLVRFAEFAKITLKNTNAKTAFADDDKISGWAKDAVYACQTANIVNGSVESGKTVFKPRGNATRAEASKILSVFHKDYM